MANTYLNNDILAQSALEAFVAELAPINVFSSNFNSDAAQKGDRVSIPIVTAQAAALDFTANYTAQGVTATSVEAVLTAHKFVSIELSDKDIANSSVVSLELYGRQKGASLAYAVFQDILSLVTTANYVAAAFTGTHTGFDDDDVIEIKTVCDTAKMPMFGRAMILNSTYYNQLLKDNTLLANTLGSNAAIQQGKIPNYRGFNWYQTDSIPANSENLVGFACSPQAIGVAMRYLAPQPGNNYNRAEAISDPNGLTIGMREWYDPTTGKMQRVFECLYGYVVGIKEGLKRIISA